VAITRGPLRFLVVDFVDLLVGFFAFRTTQRGLHAARSSFPTPNLFWAREAEHPGFLPADVIVAGGLDVFNGETCTPRGAACEE
jgi:hypothetical protein